MRAKIHPLLSVRYGLAPGAKERGEVMWPSPPIFLPRRLFVVVTSACRSFRPRLPSASFHEGRFVGVTGCIRTSSPIPSRWKASQCRGALVGDVGSLGRSRLSEALPRKGSIGQLLVRCGVGRRKIEDAGW